MASMTLTPFSSTAFRTTHSICPTKNQAPYTKRSYAVKTPLEVFHQYQPAEKKITLIQTPAHRWGASTLPLQEPWIEPKPLRIKHALAGGGEEKSAHYYCGGIPALMQAARKLDALFKENSKEKVIYVNDGHTPKSLQSGHQAHVHPSEWAADDCSTFNLFKTMLRGIGLIKEQDPTDLEHYSYLHFPFSFKNLLENPLENMRLYSQFFKQRLVHNLTAKEGVSKDDIWLCQSVHESLKYHQQLSQRIQEQQGHPSFSQSGRIYWSNNWDGMKKKEKTWKALGIDCAFMGREEIIKHTLLRPNSGIHALKIMGDGKFYPATAIRIIQFLQKNYPENFATYPAQVQELHLNKRYGCPLSVMEKRIGGSIHKVAIQSFFASLGHNQVFWEENGLLAAKPIWREVPVSGNSTVWKCSIDRKVFQERFGVESLDAGRFADTINQLLPSANLSNLHVTTWDARLDDDTVTFYLRASQGANFNSLVANKNDLRSLWENLNQFFIGDWELVSVGTCSRKTDVSNVPEYVELSQDPKYPATFLHGLSGIGYSFSGVSLETLKRKPSK